MRTTGGFRECFALSRFGHRWQPRAGESRAMSMNNKARFATWVGAIRLEGKDDMHKRGLASPDDGDALALTFVYPAERRNPQAESCIQEKLAVLKRRIV